MSDIQENNFGDQPLINNNGKGTDPDFIDDNTFQRGGYPQYFGKKSGAYAPNKAGESIAYASLSDLRVFNYITFDENEKLKYTVPKNTRRQNADYFQSAMHYSFESEAVNRFSSMLKPNIENDTIHELISRLLNDGVVTIVDLTVKELEFDILNNVTPIFNPDNSLNHYYVSDGKGGYYVTQSGNCVWDDEKLIEKKDGYKFKDLHTFIINDGKPIWYDAYTSIVRYDVNLMSTDTAVNRYQNAIMQIRNLVKDVRTDGGVVKKTREQLQQFYDDVYIAAFTAGYGVDGAGNVSTVSPEISYVQPNLNVDASKVLLDELRQNIYRMLSIVRSDELGGNQALDTILIRTKEMTDRAINLSRQIKSALRKFDQFKEIDITVENQLPRYSIIKELSGVDSVSSELKTDLIMEGQPESEVEAEKRRMSLEYGSDNETSDAIQRLMNLGDNNVG